MSSKDRQAGPSSPCRHLTGHQALSMGLAVTPRSASLRPACPVRGDAPGSVRCRQMRRRKASAVLHRRHVRGRPGPAIPVRADNRVPASAIRSNGTVPRRHIVSLASAMACPHLSSPLKVIVTEGRTHRQDHSRMIRTGRRIGAQHERLSVAVHTRTDRPVRRIGYPSGASGRVRMGRSPPHRGICPSSGCRSAAWARSAAMIALVTGPPAAWAARCWSRRRWRAVCLAGS